MKQFFTTLLVTFFLVACSKGEDPAQKRAKESYETVKNFSKSNQEKAPQLIFFSSVIKDTKCGEIDGSAYCPLNHTIYIEKSQIERFMKIDSSAVDLIVAHEYAHSMQHAYKFGRQYTVLNELQADCLAGVFLSEKYRDNLEKFKNTLLVAWSFGDFEWQYEGHHGFPNQRLQAFTVGTGMTVISKEDGVMACLDLF